LFSMVALDTMPQTDRAKLRDNYNAAFATWAREVSLLQASVADPTVSEACIERVRRRTSRAEAAYRETRDRLWQTMKP
jgi:hypothetical protein